MRCGDGGVVTARRTVAFSIASSTATSHLPHHHQVIGILFAKRSSLTTTKDDADGDILEPTGWGRMGARMLATITRVATS